MRAFLFPIQFQHTYFCCLFYSRRRLFMLVAIAFIVLPCLQVSLWCDVSYLGRRVWKRNIETFLVATLVWMPPLKWSAHKSITILRYYPPNIYLFKVNNRTLEKGANKKYQNDFTVIFEYISHLFLLFPL